MAFKGAEITRTEKARKLFLAKAQVVDRLGSGGCSVTKSIKAPQASTNTSTNQRSKHSKQQPKHTHSHILKRSFRLSNPQHNTKQNKHREQYKNMPSKTNNLDDSSSSPSSTIPVLIAGAGPVGLYQALLLTQLGIPVRIIDRDLGISPYSRALGLHARTMEILKFTGIVDPFLETGRPFSTISYFKNAQLVGTIAAMNGKQSSPFSSGLFLDQATTSKIFLDKLKELGVHVEYGWELMDTKVVEGAEGEEEYVETTIRRALSGGNMVKGEDQVQGDVGMFDEQKDKEYEIQTVRSRYLVACDGGRSTVRHKINVAFPGKTYTHKTLMWDGTCECDIPLTGFS